ncbi:MAG TPA: alpha/beta fold hydrolase [Kofleriaceae bacterium]|nr:alpha/beta fold hydrolase [Kofleriaceae bacterium]
MDLVRTPDHRFERLSGYPYSPATLRLGDDEDPALAYVVEGPHDGLTVLLLHGPPTWSYLWRQMIPMLAEAGCRVIAPDLVGFGRSDKILRPREHSVDHQVAWLKALVEHLDLRDVTVAAHGAAALLALKLVTSRFEGKTEGEEIHRFKRLVAISPLSAASGATISDLAASEQISRGCAGALSSAVRAAYDAPFPDPELAAGLRAQPSFLDGWLEDLPEVDLPLLVVTGDTDEMTDPDWITHIPGAATRRRRLVIPGAGHYLPEDRGPELALALLAFLVEKR